MSGKMPAPNDPVPQCDFNSNSTSGHLCQWSTPDGRTFTPTSRTIPVLAPGVYSVHHNHDRGIYFEKGAVSSDDLVEFVDSEVDVLIRELETFWGSRAKFEMFGLLQKRGILLYGPQGTGKTSICRMVMKQVIERQGVVIKLTHAVSLTLVGMRVLREIQPETPVVVLMEDVDVLLDDDEESTLINMLDGIDTIDRVVFIATTNHPEKMEARVVNRPGRFDRQICVSPPSTENRRRFLEHLFQKGIEYTSEELNKWVRDSADLSVAHIKALFEDVHLYGHAYDTTLERLRNMRDNLQNPSRAAGFATASG